MFAIPGELQQLLSEVGTLDRLEIRTADEKKQWCVSAHGKQGYGGTKTDTGLDGAHPFAFHLLDVETCLVEAGFGKSCCASQPGRTMFWKTRRCNCAISLPLALAMQR